MSLLILILFLVLYECEENVCVNGGTCSLIAGDTVCSCLDEYTGINCGTFIVMKINMVLLLF